MIICKHANMKDFDFDFDFWISDWICTRVQCWGAFGWPCGLLIGCRSVGGMGLVELVEHGWLIRDVSCIA